MEARFWGGRALLAPVSGSGCGFHFALVVARCDRPSPQPSSERLLEVTQRKQSVF
jgi:hypothetical protein